MHIALTITSFGPAVAEGECIDVRPRSGLPIRFRRTDWECRFLTRTARLGQVVP
jgi:hypothetical protein